MTATFVIDVPLSLRWSYLCDHRRSQDVTGGDAAGVQALGLTLVGVIAELFGPARTIVIAGLAGLGSTTLLVPDLSRPRPVRALSLHRRP
jgi:hypothetical protein